MQKTITLHADSCVHRVYVFINLHDVENSISISGCWSLSKFLRHELAVVKNPQNAVGILILSVIVSEVQVFPVLAANCYFRLSGAMAVTWTHFPADRGRKSEICCQNFNPDGCNSRYKSISAFGCHVIISGIHRSRPIGRLQTEQLLRVAVVENHRSASPDVGISMFSVLFPVLADIAISGCRSLSK